MSPAVTGNGKIADWSVLIVSDAIIDYAGERHCKGVKQCFRIC